MNILFFLGQASIGWLNTDTALGAIISIIAVVIVYLLSPTLKAVLGIKSKNQDGKDKQEIDFRKWFIERADKLEDARDLSYNRVAEENAHLTDRLNTIENVVKNKAILVEDLEKKIRTLQWLYLSEVCEDLMDRVRKSSDEIASRLRASGDDQLAQEVERELNKIIEQARQHFVVKQIERDADEINGGGNMIMAFDSLQERIEKQIEEKRKKMNFTGKNPHEK